MDRPRQPATRPAPRRARRASGRARDAEAPTRRRGRDEHRDDEEWPDRERSTGVRALLHGFAVVRWILLIFAVGFGAAAVVAIAFAALLALINASV